MQAVFEEEERRRAVLSFCSSCWKCTCFRGNASTVKSTAFMDRLKIFEHRTAIHILEPGQTGHRFGRSTDINMWKIQHLTDAAKKAGIQIYFSTHVESRLQTSVAPKLSNCNGTVYIPGRMRGIGATCAGWGINKCPHTSV